MSNRNSHDSHDTSPLYFGLELSLKRYKYQSWKILSTFVYGVGTILRAHIQSLLRTVKNHPEDVASPPRSDSGQQWLSFFST